MSGFFEIIVLCFGFVSSLDVDLINGADGDSGARNTSAADDAVADAAAAAADDDDDDASPCCSRPHWKKHGNHTRP